MKNINVAYIGYGERGRALLGLVLEQVDAIGAVCDIYEDRAEACAKAVEESRGVRPAVYTDYKDAIADENVNVVMILTAWESHIPIALEAMRAGKAVTLEVGGAYSVEDCWELVRTQESTGVPFMFLENCCFGRRELMVLNMVEKGLFGKVVHCSGGYHHDLREEIAFGRENRHYRLRNYLSRNCENYPTHELGPISKVLNINRGNRFVSLTSFGSKNVGLKDYAKNRFGEDSVYAKEEYKQNDIVTTILNCAGGETVTIVLDTTLPRAYYTRNFSVRGTRGMSSEERRVVFIEGMKEGIENNEEEMYEKYDHPLHREYMQKGVKEGHGGIDWLVCRAFVESVKAGTNTPIDAYDTATWLAVGVLSEQSLASGNSTVAFPDFTDGKWQNREEDVKSKYCLSEIVEDSSISVV